ncbi:hypothetical protein LQ327_09085 [Actinomycetospora endophytica]|uniref:Uncharacterized protein n=1 Tax=Actinomycetospora endophytica TaxID=2291215 RepID=A0ABS8P5L5_9PSEU|nr:hypothetical protein [Actinomycetospora endophytica]MCD2193536.1 hypothetical protein [Actinomycetospora endophytica]
MSTPVAFTYQKVWVRAQYADLHTGSPIVGRHLQAVPSARWFTDTDHQVILGPSPVAEVTDSFGRVAVLLECLDDPRLNPQGATWQITDPLRRTFPLRVSVDTPVFHAPTPAPGQDRDPLDGQQVIDLASVLPEAAPDGGTVQIEQGPQGIQGVPGPPLAPPIRLDYQPMVSIDCSRGDHFRITLGGPLVLAEPTHPVDGARLFVELIQDQVGNRPLTLDPIFNLGFDINSIDLSPQPGRRDHLGAMFNADVGLWDVVGMVRGY